MLSCLSVASLGGQVSVSRLGTGVYKVTKTESDTDVRNLGNNAASSVEDGIVQGTSEKALFKRREDVGHDTL